MPLLQLRNRCLDCSYWGQWFLPQNSWWTAMPGPYPLILLPSSIPTFCVWCGIWRFCVCIFSLNCCLYPLCHPLFPPKRIIHTLMLMTARPLTVNDISCIVQEWWNTCPSFKESNQLPNPPSMLKLTVHNVPQEVTTMLRANELNPIQPYCTRNPLVLFTSSISIVLKSPGHVCKMKLS